MKFYLHMNIFVIISKIIVNLQVNTSDKWFVLASFIITNKYNNSCVLLFCFKHQIYRYIINLLTLMYPSSIHLFVFIKYKFSQTAKTE